MEGKWTALDEAREIEKELEELDNPDIGHGIGYRGVDQGGYPLTPDQKLAIYGPNYYETISYIKELPDVDGRQLVERGVTADSIGRRNLHTLLDMRDLDPKIKKYLEDKRIELYNLYHQTSPEFRRGGNYQWDLPWNPWPIDTEVIFDEAARAWGPENSFIYHIPEGEGIWRTVLGGPRARGTPPSPDPAFHINPGQTQYNAVLNVRNPKYAPDAQNPIMDAVRRRRREARSGPDPTDSQGNPYMLEDRPLPPGLRGARSSQSYQGQGVGSRESLRGGGRRKTKKRQRGGSKKRVKRSMRKNR